MFANNQVNVGLGIFAALFFVSTSACMGGYESETEPASKGDDELDDTELQIGSTLMTLGNNGSQEDVVFEIPDSQRCYQYVLTIAPTADVALVDDVTFSGLFYSTTGELITGRVLTFPDDDVQPDPDYPLGYTFYRFAFQQDTAAQVGRVVVNGIYVWDEAVGVAGPAEFEIALTGQYLLPAASDEGCGNEGQGCCANDMCAEGLTCTEGTCSAIPVSTDFTTAADGRTRQFRVPTSESRTVLLSDICGPDFGSYFGVQAVLVNDSIVQGAGQEVAFFLEDGQSDISMRLGGIDRDTEGSVTHMRYGAGAGCGAGPILRIENGGSDVAFVALDVWLE